MAKENKGMLIIVTIYLTFMAIIKNMQNNLTKEIKELGVYYHGLRAKSTTVNGIIKIMKECVRNEKCKDSQKKVYIECLNRRKLYIILERLATIILLLSIGYCLFKYKIG